MGRPTTEETIEMQYRKFVKEIWDTEFNRSKDELTEVSLGKQFINIKTAENGIIIHRNLFEDYFSAVDAKLKIIYRERIKKSLENLL